MIPLLQLQAGAESGKAALSKGPGSISENTHEYGSRLERTHMMQQGLGEQNEWGQGGAEFH